jgi:hypothetical protein
MKLTKRPWLPVMCALQYLRAHKASHPVITTVMILDISPNPGTWRVVSHPIRDRLRPRTEFSEEGESVCRTIHEFTKQRPGLVKPPDCCQRRKEGQALETPTSAAPCLFCVLLFFGPAPLDSRAEG